MRNLLMLLIPALALGLGGCSTFGGNSAELAPSQRLPERYALPEHETPREVAREGAIYNGSQGLDLYRDNRAREVGDILLVRVVESSSGRSNANTKTERESSVAGGIDSFFGLGDFIDRYGTVQARINKEFEGTGRTSRDNNVSATISARVIDKTMDGNLVVRAYQEVRVNNETQFIILSGLVRPDDITADNAVLSNRVADFRIEYSGKGAVADEQQPGWFSRAVGLLWPF